jgi:hypothetical protein
MLEDVLIETFKCVLLEKRAQEITENSKYQTKLLKRC